MDAGYSFVKVLRFSIPSSASRSQMAREIANRNLITGLISRPFITSGKNQKWKLQTNPLDEEKNMNKRRQTKHPESRPKSREDFPKE